MKMPDDFGLLEDGWFVIPNQNNQHLKKEHRFAEVVCTKIKQMNTC